MDKLKYYLIAYKTESLPNLIRYMDEIKDITSAINYKLKSNKSQERIIITTLNLTNISLIIKTSIDNSDKVNELESINLFLKVLNMFLSKKTKFTKKLVDEVLFKIELTELLANKTILDLKKNRKREFDLLTAITFNDSINSKLSMELEDEFDTEKSQDYVHISRGQTIENDLKYYKYSEENLNDIISDIQSTIKINIDIKDEVLKINEICFKVKNPINYIIMIEYEGLYEDEISKILLSQQYIKGIFKNPIVETIDLIDITNPPRSFSVNGRSREIGIPFSQIGSAMEINNIDELMNITDNELNKLITFINKANSPFILIINSSKVKNNINFNKQILRLKQSIVYREIVIDKPSNKSYLDIIKRELDLKGYKLTNMSNSEKFMDNLNTIYENKLRVSDIQAITNKIIFTHQLNNQDAIIDMSKMLEENSNSEHHIKPESGLEKLENMIGLNELKNKVLEYISLYKINEERKNMNLPTEQIYMHMILKGNPGTGKTSFARLFSQILKEEGILEKGDLIEASRDSLIAKYVGWTAKNVTEYFNKSKGSVLFIDEAYLLATDYSDGFGAEAIGTIVKNMEDYKDVVVIMAGYPNEMDHFIKSNPGMKSRIALDLTIEDYSSNELLCIFKQFCNARGYTYNNEVLKLVEHKIVATLKSKEIAFGNARYARKLFERLILVQSRRVLMKGIISKKSLMEIKPEDFKNICKDIDIGCIVLDKNIGFRNN